LVQSERNAGGGGRIWGFWFCSQVLVY
jgi:hypothetical protein